MAMGTSGEAIVFAGLTTVFALAGMFLVGLPVFTSLGFSAQVVVVIAVLSALTLLPALIAAPGGGINRLRLPFLQHFSTRSGHAGPWAWIIDHVLRRPLVAVVALLALTAPALAMNLGFNGPRSFPSDAAGTQALIALEDRLHRFGHSSQLVYARDATSVAVVSDRMEPANATTLARPFCAVHGIYA